MVPDGWSGALAGRPGVGRLKTKVKVATRVRASSHRFDGIRVGDGM